MEKVSNVRAGKGFDAAHIKHHALARSILGMDFITLEMVAAARGLSVTEAQIIELGRRLPDQATLEMLRDSGMFLAASPPTAMSFLNIRALNPDYFFSKGPDQGYSDWYDHSSEKFASTDKVEALCWIAFPKEPVEKSFDRIWSDQQALVQEPMVIPNAAEAAWALTTYKAVHGIDLFKDVFARTASVWSGGDHVFVGFIGGGFDVVAYLDNDWDFDLGVSASRKF